MESNSDDRSNDFDLNSPEDQRNSDLEETSLEQPKSLDENAVLSAVESPVSNEESQEVVEKEEDKSSDEDFSGSESRQQLDGNTSEVERSDQSDSESKTKEDSQIDEDQVSAKPNDGENDSDSEEEEEDKVKRDKLKEAEEIFGDSESEDEEFEGFKKASDEKAKETVVDDSDEEDMFLQRKRKRILNSDSDSDDQDNKKVKDSDDEDLANKDEEEATSAPEKDEQSVLPEISSSEDEDDHAERRSGRGDLVYDFDIMMAKRKEQNARNRKRKNTDLINDSDDIIADLISQMKQAAEDDFELNKDRKAATRKMKLLPLVQTQLRKIDLREAFLDAGVLSVMTDWLTPLPDRSLPNLQVRENLLKILLEFNIMDVDRLKASGVGKAVMYLFKHPKEIKENKKRAGQLIGNWSRPIFSCESDYQSISKEDREQRDFDHMNKFGKRSKGEDIRRGDETATQILRPGDKGWVPRARVPQPSTKEYVVRPSSSVEMDMSRGSSKKAVSRLEKHMRHFQERKRAQKATRAVKISIEGRKL